MFTATIAQQSSTSSSNIVLSAGAPSFGGGGSFETLDFSLPSYDQAVSGSQGSDLNKPSDDGGAAAKVSTIYLSTKYLRILIEF